MTQNDLNRAVAAATAKTVRTTAEMGFVLRSGIPIERKPLVVDWDQVQQQRVSVFPQRRGREPVPA